MIFGGGGRDAGWTERVVDPKLGKTTSFPSSGPLAMSSPLDPLCQQHGYASYEDYLLSKRWRAFKRRYLKSKRGKTCLICGESKRLEFHHILYDRICRERFSDVILLCRPHHREVHERLRSRGLPIRLTMIAVEELRSERPEGPHR